MNSLPKQMEHGQALVTVFWLWKLSSDAENSDVSTDSLNRSTAVLVSTERSNELSTGAVVSAVKPAAFIEVTPTASATTDCPFMSVIVTLSIDSHDRVCVRPMFFTLSSFRSTSRIENRTVRSSVCSRSAPVVRR